MDAIFSSVFNNLPLSRSIIRTAIQQTLWVERNGMLGELTWKKIKNIIEHWDQAFWNYLQVVGCNTCSVHFRGDIFDADTGRREYSFKRTIKYDSHMLDKPDFVGSYEVGDHVYFFFREMAVEYMNCGRAVYSRYLSISGKILNVPMMTNTTLLDFLQGCQSLQEGHWWEEHLGSELGHLLEGQAKLLHPRRVPLLLQRDSGRVQSRSGH